ncbi:ribosome recycling factor [Neomegalonema sp.]|uniref:ribosome recycling factor n=1 Tax=Neomegalonema sp. TaxID=2039713 RepID=UPI00260F3C6E|nr:ribosome recycling factor [Neomegalonema sp.]MDD2869866.1 ribosome recycling factor [Neomegalonema sp.]
MSDADFDLDPIKRRMEGAIASLKQEFQTLRTGRAASSMLEPITVVAYGAPTPLTQLASVSVPEARMLAVNVWDRSLVGAVEKAIRNSGLGVNPMVDGPIIRIVVPELNEERRRELTKVAGKYAEAARVAVRNVRRDGMDQLKKAKSSGMSEDEHDLWGEEIQSLTDVYVKRVDEALTVKEKEIMQV